MSHYLAFLAGTTAVMAVMTMNAAEAKTPQDQLVIGMNMVNLTSLDPHNVNSYES
jgi:peptide/nickel transport system substrate-binding protein